MDQEGSRQPVHIEQGMRKAPKIGGQLEAIDLAALLLLFVFVPILGRQLFNANAFVLVIPGVLYIVFISLFKINKPTGYFQHFLKFHNRSRIWSPSHYVSMEPFEQDARGEGSLPIKKMPRSEVR